MAYIDEVLADQPAAYWPLNTAGLGAAVTRLAPAA